MRLYLVEISQTRVSRCRGIRSRTTWGKSGAANRMWMYTQNLVYCLSRALYQQLRFIKVKKLPSLEMSADRIIGTIHSKPRTSLTPSRYNATQPPTNMCLKPCDTQPSNNCSGVTSTVTISLQSSKLANRCGKASLIYLSDAVICLKASKLG